MHIFQDAYDTFFCKLKAFNIIGNKSNLCYMSEKPEEDVHRAREMHVASCFFLAYTCMLAFWDYANKRLCLFYCWSWGNICNIAFAFKPFSSYKIADNWCECFERLIKNNIIHEDIHPLQSYNGSNNDTDIFAMGSKGLKRDNFLWCFDQMLWSSSELKWRYSTCRYPPISENPDVLPWFWS